MDSLVDAALRMQSGFGNFFESEALPGALPVGRNSPQNCAHGLYAEQLSGSPFTAPRAANERSWLYRIRPSIAHWGALAAGDAGGWRTAPCDGPELPPVPMRWDPLPAPAMGGPAVVFPDGMHTITTAGDAGAQTGMAAHVYVLSGSMRDASFCNADGELLFVPQEGGLRLHTEFGVMEVRPGWVALIPRGVKFRVVLLGAWARGYVCENYGGGFSLPERGPIGANCLANPRDFLTPHAAYEDVAGPHRLTVKSGGVMWACTLEGSPLDVVAWHGNYVPWCYDLRRFAPVGPLLFDHADPSIFTVLSAPSDTPGTANVDFVIFPERWAVAEDTFRPPWYHLNVMSEFMGLIEGVYDAKPEGFVPGGFSLHNAMVPHGPDAGAYEAARTAVLGPVRLSGTLAFMFETRLPQRVTAAAAALPQFQRGYGGYGAALPRRFDAGRP